MKPERRYSLPQIIILIIIVAVGASIVLDELGLVGGKGAAGLPGMSGPPPGALTAAPAGLPASPATASGAASGAQPAAPGSAATGAANGENSAPQARSIAVRSAVVASGSLSVWTKLYGEVVPEAEVKLYPEVAGRILERKVQVGQRIGRDAPVALVDPSKPGQSYLPNAVESTVAGTVLSIPVQVGDTVTTGTVIATIASSSRTKVAVQVPERFLASLRSGSRARLSFDALPGKEFSGRIVELGAVVDSLSRSLEVGIALDAPDARILAGMSATVRLETASRQNVLLVPRTALIVSSQGSAVYIVKSDNTVERRGIETGLEGEAFIELKRGLVAGEILVTEGASTLSEGDRVRIVVDTAQAGGSR